MFKKRLGFTLVEIVLVLLIVGLLFVAVSRLFKPNNKNKLYSEICLNTLYGETRNYINKAVTGKSVASGGVSYYPDTYTISLDQPNNRIDLGYTYTTGTTAIGGIYKKIYLTGTMKTIKECEDASYSVVFTGNVTTITITKNLKEKIGHPSFSFTGTTSAITGGIDFFLIENKGTARRHFYTIVVDPRTQSITSRKCLSLPSDITKQCATGLRSQ